MKDFGRWFAEQAGPVPAVAPKRVRLHLTDGAEAEHEEFRRYYGDGNCSCHISPPCGSCTHPGNPLNQAEDDSAWVWGAGKGEGS